VSFPEESPAGKDEAASVRAAAAAQWLRRNPHRLDLGKLGLAVAGQDITPDRLSNIRQRLDLWRGRIESRFKLDGADVLVRTLVHPRVDAVAVRIESRLVAQGSLGLRLRFPNAPAHWRYAWTWDRPEEHTTEMTHRDGGFLFHRRLGSATYAAMVRTGADVAANVRRGRTTTRSADRRRRPRTGDRLRARGRGAGGTRFRSRRASG
jgi:hypothetical protein